MLEPYVYVHYKFTDLIQVIGNSDKRGQEQKCLDMDFSSLKATLKSSQRNL